MFGGLSIYVGRWTRLHPSTASSSVVNGFRVLIFALAAASQVTFALGAPSFVPVGLLVVMGVVAVVDQLVRGVSDAESSRNQPRTFSETDR
jgi:hypothetical protein